MDALFFFTNRKPVFLSLIFVIVLNTINLKAQVVPLAGNATDITINSFKANWMINTSVNGYRLYVFKYSKISPSQSVWVPLTDFNPFSIPVNTTSDLDIKGLLPGEKYKYHLTYLRAGGESGQSNEVYVTTKLLDLKTEYITPVSVKLKWEREITASNYRLFLKDETTSEERNVTLSVGQFSHSIENLIPNRNYSAFIRVYKSIVDFDDYDLISVKTLLAAPTAVKSATGITHNSFQANWNSLAGASSYLLTVYNPASNEILVKEVDQSGLQFIVKGLSPATTYKYKVKVNYSGHFSEWSAEAEVKTKPEPPLLLAPTDISANSFIAKWNALAGATGYKLTVISVQNGVPNPTGYSPKSLGNMLSHVITGLTPATKYLCWVQAITPDGESLASNTFEPETKPNPPLAKDATNITPASFTANWQDVSRASGYKLFVNRKSDKQFVTGYNGKNIAVSTESVTGLMSDTEYEYYVIALKNSSESEKSGTVSVKTSLLSTNQYMTALITNPANGGITDGSGTYQQGTTVKITAKANSGFEFVNWTEGTNILSTSPIYTFEINSNRSLTANFKQTSPIIRN